MRALLLRRLPRDKEHGWVGVESEPIPSCAQELVRRQPVKEEQPKVAAPQRIGVIGDRREELLGLFGLELAFALLFTRIARDAGERVWTAQKLLASRPAVQVASHGEKPVCLVGAALACDTTDEPDRVLVAYLDPLSGPPSAPSDASSAGARRPRSSAACSALRSAPIRLPELANVGLLGRRSRSVAGFSPSATSWRRARARCRAPRAKARDSRPTRDSAARRRCGRGTGSPSVSLPTVGRGTRDPERRHPSPRTALRAARDGQCRRRVSSMHCDSLRLTIQVNIK